MLGPAFETFDKGFESLLVVFLIDIVVVGEFVEVVGEDSFLFQRVLAFCFGFFEDELLVIQTLFQRFLGGVIGG